MTNVKRIAGERNVDLLNEHHKLRLRVTFQHIDSVLTELEHILVDSASDSPFNRYVSDTTPIQQKVAHDYVLRIRAALARISKEQQISFGEPHCGSRWAANTALLYAAVAVDELDPNRLRGYGRISDAGYDLLETIGAELHSLIAKLQTYLAQGANADLQLRIERLEKVSSDVTLLKDLGRIITSYGSAETLAYLPRCDLGLLMIDASLGVSVEDFAVADALYRAGGTVMVLISKADLFNCAERLQMIEYVARQIKHELRILPPIFPVSVIGESSVLCDNWFKEHLQPMLKSHQELAATATNRKIAVLRNALIATLETRQGGGGQSAASEGWENKEVLNAFGEVEKSFDKIVQRSFELGRGISDQAPLILKVTVERIAISWRNRSAAESSQILTATIAEFLAQPIAQIEEEYYCIRNQAWKALHTAERSFPHGLSLELPGALGMPPLDPASLAQKLQAKRPALTTVLILPLVKWQLHRRFHRQISLI